MRAVHAQPTPPTICNFVTAGRHYSQCCCFEVHSEKNVMYWMGWQLSHGINTQENWSLSWWSWWKRYTLSVLLLRLCCILFFLFCHRECSCNIQTTWIQNMASETFFTCFRVIKYCIFASCWDMAVPLPSARLLRKLNDIHIKLDWVIICVN